MHSLRVGIVGCGRMGKEHARAAHSLGACVSFLYDKDFSRAQALAAQYAGSIVYESPDAIDWSSINAVFVCTPPITRGPIELAAIEAGVHLFVEKPVGISAQQCQPINEALKSKPLISAVGYMNRYRHSVLSAKEILETHAPIGITSNWFGPRYKVEWWSDYNQSGGPFNEQGTHMVDLNRLFMGEVVEVFAIGERGENSKSFDSVLVTLRFVSGSLGSIYYSCRAIEKQVSLQVFLPSSRICLEGWNLQSVSHEGGRNSIADGEEIFIKEDAAFFDAILGKNQSLVKSSFQDATRTQTVVDAIHRSLELNNSVPVPDSIAS